MNQEDIELKLLHDHHVKNMILLQKQRQLLDKENPKKYKMTTTSADKSNHQIKASQLPILRPDNVIQQLFYYPPSVTDSNVAARTSLAVLDHWSNQTQYVPKDIHLKHVLKYGKKQYLDLQLTPSGARHVQDLVQYSKKYKQLVQVPLKQKYSKNHTAKILQSLQKGRMPRTQPNSQSK